jgi:putative transposase
VLDIDSVLAKDTETGDTQRLKVHELEPPIPGQPAQRTPELDLAVIADEDWQIAQHRFSIIRPLIESSGNNIEEVDTQAKIAEVHRATIYRGSLGVSRWSI